MNKRLAILIISTLLVSMNGFAQWVKLFSPTSEMLNEIVFSENIGWCIGNKGVILKLENNVWRSVSSPVDQNLNGVVFLSKTNGWIVGDKGTILHYNGTDWKKVKSPTTLSLYSVAIIDSNQLVAVGAKGVFLLLQNGEWKVIEKKIKGNLFALGTLGNEIWVGGTLECNKIPLLHFTYNNSSMVQQRYDNCTDIISVHAVDRNDVWAVTSTGGPLHFNGSSWQKITLSDKAHSALADVYFDDKQQGICVGNSGTVFVYQNHKWTQQKLASTKNLKSAIINNGYYYAVGDSGRIFSNAPLFVQPSEISVLNREILVYPNPCNSHFTLSLTLEADGTRVSVTISDSHGRLVYSNDYNGNKGVFSKIISVKGFENGSYFVSVKAGDKFSKSKLLVYK